MCINKQKNGDAGRISSTFMGLREEHCRDWFTERSLGLFASIWSRIEARSFALEINGQKRKASMSYSKNRVLYLEIIIKEAELVWGFLFLVFSDVKPTVNTVNAAVKPTPAIRKTEEGHCVSAVLWLLLMHSR